MQQEMKKAAIFILILLPLSSGAQNGIIPLSLLKLRDNYSFDNPASAVLSESFDLKLLHSSYTNLPGKAGLNYADANFTIKKEAGNNAHIPGLLIHSEYETSILKRTRFYLRYSWNTKITEKMKLSAGLHVGFLNYSIRASNSSSGLSSFAPDANLGIWVHGKKINIGISSAQILNAKIIPVSTPYLLKRYLIIIADYKLLSNSNSALTVAVKFDHDGKELKDAKTGFVYQMKNFNAEINYSYNKGIIFSGGLVRLPVSKLNADLFFSYFYSGNKYLNNDRIELNTRIYLIKATEP